MASRILGVLMIIIGLILIALTMYYITLHSPNTVPGVSTTTITVTRNLIIPYTKTTTITIAPSTSGTKTTIYRTLYKPLTTTLTTTTTTTITLYTTIHKVETTTLVNTITKTMTLTKTLYKTTTITQTISPITELKAFYLNLTNVSLYTPLKLSLGKVLVGDSEHQVYVNSSIKPEGNNSYIVTIDLLFSPPLPGMVHLIGFTGLHNIVKVAYTNGGYHVELIYKPKIEESIEKITLYPITRGDSIALTLLLPKHRLESLGEYWYLVVGTPQVNDIPMYASYIVDKIDGSIVFAYTNEYSSGNSIVIVKVYPNGLFAKSKIVYFSGERIRYAGLWQIGSKYLLGVYGSFYTKYTITKGLLLVILDRELNMLDHKFLKVNTTPPYVTVIGSKVYIVISGTGSNNFTLLVLNDELEIVSARKYLLNEDRLLWCKISGSDGASRLVLACTGVSGNNTELYMLKLDDKGIVLGSRKVILGTLSDKGLALLSSINANKWGSCVVTVMFKQLPLNRSYLIVDMDNQVRVFEITPAVTSCYMSPVENKVYVVFGTRHATIALLDVEKNTIERTLALPATSTFTTSLKVAGNNVYYLSVARLYNSDTDILFLKLPLDLQVKLGYQVNIPAGILERTLPSQQVEVKSSDIPWPYDLLPINLGTLSVEEYHKPIIYSIKYLTRTSLSFK